MGWTKEKLESIKLKYGEDMGETMFDPESQRVANQILSAGGGRPAPYAGIPSLLDAQLKDFTDDVLNDHQVALIGVPMDLGVTNRPGARFGARALRSIERIGPYNDGLNVAPLHQMRVADVGDVKFRSRYDLAKCHEDIEDAIQRIVSAGTIPLSVGGDHSISHPILRAVGSERPVGMVHIDAHCDTGGPFDQERFHHGGPFRNAVLDGVLDPERTIQIGIRGAASFMWEFSHETGMTVINARDIDGMGIDAVIAKTLEVIGSGPTYISLDVDSIDPAYTPGTGTPEVGGLTPREVQALLRGLKGMNIVGGDVVEVSPQYDPTTNTAQTAAQMLFEILSLVPFSPALKSQDI